MDTKRGGALLVALALGLLINLAVGGLDYLTGTEIGFSVFYLIPISLVAWTAGRNAGLFMSVVAIGTAVGTDYLAGKVFGQLFVETWNALIRLASFFIVAFLVARLRADIDERNKLIAELQEALENVKTLGGLLPICAWCKNIRDDQGYWKKVETYIAEHSTAEFTHGICPECAKKLYPKLSDKPPKEGPGPEGRTRDSRQ
jgi:hypothetical protein